MVENRLELLKKSILNGEAVSAKQFNHLILEKVSRTYALTIKALGQPFREPVLLGYLFCRIADTYEDTTTLPFEVKKEALEVYRDLFKKQGNDSALLNRLKELVEPFSDNDDEEFLAKRPEIVFEQYQGFPDGVKEITERTVVEMVNGMISTIEKQENQGTVGTDSENDLDQYCYYVAGTVGNMLTSLFRYYSPWIGEKLYSEMEKYNEDFGQALQLTNIIKDAMGDLKRGVSFIPKDLAKEYGVDLDKLYLPEHRDSAHKVMNRLITKAVSKLNLALKYSLLIPKQEPRMRLFCIMPVFFAIKTLAVAVNNEELLKPDGKVKITRDIVKKTLRYITINCVWDYMLVKDYKKDLKTIEDGLGISIPFPFKDNPVLPITSIED